MDDLVTWLRREAAMDLQGARALPSALGGLRSRFSPAKLVADYEAKLRIIEAARAYSPELEHGDNGEWALDMTLRLLALPYADRPGYREEWRP